MSILDKNINTPLPEVADWWNIEFRVNAASVRPFIPDEALNHLQTIPRWIEFIRQRILTQHCNADGQMLICICESIIKSELIYVKDIQIGWPRIYDDETICTIMAVTPWNNKETIGALVIKDLR